MLFLGVISVIFQLRDLSCRIKVHCSWLRIILFEYVHRIR